MAIALANPGRLDQSSTAGRHRVSLLSENRVLREKLGKKRILLSDEQRMRLAIKGKILGRKLLKQLADIVTPDTILRWHREQKLMIDSRARIEVISARALT